MSLIKSFHALVAASVLACPLASSAGAQAPAAPATQSRSQSAAALNDSLQQLGASLDRLQHALSALTVSKWKAPGDVRQTTQADVDSMQRDLTGTLPGLLAAAHADPTKLAPVFAVYRNVDALYDVLLRVSETAQLAGATNDGRSLEEQRTALEASRRQVSTALLQSAQAQDAEVMQLRTPPPSAPAAAAGAGKTVVDDGPPAKAKPATRRRKPATPPPQ